MVVCVAKVVSCGRTNVSSLPDLVSLTHYHQLQTKCTHPNKTSGCLEAKAKQTHA